MRSAVGLVQASIRFKRVNTMRTCRAPWPTPEALSEQKKPRGTIAPLGRSDVAAPKAPATKSR